MGVPINPDPVDDAGKHSHRAGAPNHYMSGGNTMVVPNITSRPARDTVPEAVYSGVLAVSEVLLAAARGSSALPPVFGVSVDTRPQLQLSCVSEALPAVSRWALALGALTVTVTRYGSSPADVRVEARVQSAVGVAVAVWSGAAYADVLPLLAGLGTVGVEPGESVELSAADVLSVLGEHVVGGAA